MINSILNSNRIERKYFRPIHFNRISDSTIDHDDANTITKIKFTEFKLVLLASRYLYRNTIDFLNILIDMNGNIEKINAILFDCESILFP
jgi:hypothetical protein